MKANLAELNDDLFILITAAHGKDDLAALACACPALRDLLQLKVSKLVAVGNDASLVVTDDGAVLQTAWDGEGGAARRRGRQTLQLVAAPGCRRGPAGCGAGPCGGQRGGGARAGPRSGLPHQQLVDALHDAAFIPAEWAVWAAGTRQRAERVGTS
jgi:hypothetical protein